MPIDSNDIDFNTKFDLSNNPERFELEDVTDYAGNGVANADVRGVFKLTDPFSNVFYNNQSFDNPDIDGGTSFINQNVLIPKDQNNALIYGDYSIEYTVRVDDPIIAVDTGTNKITIVGDAAKKALIDSSPDFEIVRSTANDGTYTVLSSVVVGPNIEITTNEPIVDATVDGSIQYDDQEEYVGVETVTFSDLCPKIDITQTVDCNCGIFESIDNTQYGENFTILSRTHTVYYPAALEISPVVETSTTNNKVTVTPIYTKTWSTNIETVVEYDLGSGNTIECTVVGTKDIEVNCDINLCELSCCLIKLNDRYLDSLTKTGESAQTKELYEELTRITGQLIPLFNMARECGKNDSAEEFLAEIKKVAGCGEGCCDDSDEPQQIVPVCSAGGGSTVQVAAGQGVTVTTNITGNTVTYTVSIEDTLYDFIQTLAPVNVVGGTDISVIKTVVSGVDTYTVNYTGTAGDTPEELAIRVKYKADNPAAGSVLTEQTYVVEKGSSWVASGSHSWVEDATNAVITLSGFLNTPTDDFTVQANLVKYFKDQTPVEILQSPFELRILHVDDDEIKFHFIDNDGNALTVVDMYAIAQAYSASEFWEVEFDVLIKHNY